VSTYTIRQVPFDAPYHWLAAGWRDTWRVPRLSLAYGAIFATVGLLLVVGLTQVGLLSLILVLAGGFILIGPMLAAGLYETSRRLEQGEPASLASTLRAGFYGKGQLAFMGLLLMLVYLAWIEIAFLLFMLFFGPQPMPPLDVFVSNLLLTPRGLGLLIVGTGVGLVLAAIVFAISACKSGPKFLTSKSRRGINSTGLSSSSSTSLPVIGQHDPATCAKSSFLTIEDLGAESRTTDD